MTYEINFFLSNHDNIVRLSEHLQWDDVVGLFSEHTQTEDKDGMMFNFCEYKRTDFAPAERKIYINGVDTGERELKLDNDGQLQIGRLADNVLSYNCLVLDYDGEGATLETAIRRFADYTHLGYTSHNHVIKGVDKFRVILPFATPCPINEWKSRSESFLLFAGKEIDRSTVAISRAFYLPTCPPTATEHTAVWNMDGALLDWTTFAVTKTYTAPTTPPQPVNNVELNEVLDELRKHMPIMPYEKRFALVRAVAQHVSKNEAISAMRSRWDDSSLNGKYEAMLSAPLKANGPTLGSVIFEVRKYNPAFKVAATTDQYGEVRIARQAQV